MTKLHFDRLPDQTEQTRQVGDWKCSQSYPPSDYHKTTHLKEDSQVDSPEEVDSLGEAGSLEEEGILEGAEVHLEDHQQEVGGHHQLHTTSQSRQTGRRTAHNLRWRQKENDALH